MHWLRWSIGTLMTEGKREQVFRGLGVSGGVAIGPIYILSEKTAARRNFTTAEGETRAFREAVASANGQLEALIASQDKLAAEILEFQLALLDDDDLLAPVFRAIEGGVPWDEAWSVALDREIAEYRESGGAALAARADDLADLRNRVLRATDASGHPRGQIPPGSILVVAELTPSTFVDLDWEGIAGAVSLGGSPVSHVSILARARGVNFVVGLNAKLDDIGQGAIAILDATKGLLVVHPSGQTLASANVRIDAEREDRAEMEALLRRPAATARGEPVKIMVNIDEPDRLNVLSPDFCDGVGLTRTEFLFIAEHLPGENEQLTFYRRLIAWAAGRPVTIRTLDAGGDKPIAGVTIDGEANPFLGVRGLRLSFARPEIFRVQLRALARAAADGPINVMFPMVTVPAELSQARRMMLAEVADLQRAGVNCTAPRMGIMVEVPAAALTAADFDADFYSIGSNDLIQYATACARDNTSLATLADARNPAVAELIRRTVEAARRRGVDVSLCGDMASSPELIGALLDTGLRTLSCAPAQIGAVKLAVSRYAPKPA
jgi:phosphotransferase system enzyme I (PtsI)